MAKLAPEFRNDLFISYAQGDVDGTGDAPLKTWSVAFARELKRELRTLRGLQSTTVFIDDSRRPEAGLDVSDPLTEQLRSAASNSALLLVLMSPHYVESKWCRLEREWWLEQSTAQAFPEIGSRVFVARIWPTEDKDWPSELCDEAQHPPLGVWFHSRPGGEFTSRPFGWPQPTEITGDPFRDAVVTLAGDVASRIKGLNGALMRKRQSAADLLRLSAPGGQAIYVHARARDRRHWEDTCEQLITAGYGVFPASPEEDARDPRETIETDGEIVRTLSACDALLLVPGDDPRSLISDLAVVGHQRRNSARALARRSLPCAVIDRGIKLQAKARLQQSARNLHIDWIDAVRAELSSEVKTWLNAAGEKQSPP